VGCKIIFFNKIHYLYFHNVLEMQTLREILNIEHPIIAAPMFLISNVEMVVEACKAGASGAFPALNYRTDEALRAAIADIKKQTDKSFGVNLIVNKSNPKYKAQLDTLVELRVPYIITSLGSPEETIRKCKPHGIKVFCDVINAEMAKKVEALGADAIIAVNNKAGGHCGNLNREDLINSIRQSCSLPIISAGGVGTADQVKEVLDSGVAGLSIGTVFLAAKEAPISTEYQSALVQYGEKDIVLTTKLSGSHLTVINTPYVQSMGTEATFWEKLMKKNKFLKKYIKFFVFLKGMNLIEKSAFQATYKTVWCAGPTIEHIKSIRPMKEIIQELCSKISYQ
jgi:nitronate monooxygenase